MLVKFKNIALITKRSEPAHAQILPSTKSERQGCGYNGLISI